MKRIFIQTPQEQGMNRDLDDNNLQSINVEADSLYRQDIAQACAAYRKALQLVRQTVDRQFPQRSLSELLADQNV